jgi:hypothetical protein
MKTIQRYVRLLSYDNACKVVEFVNKNDKNDDANIITGGLSIKTTENNLDKIETFIKSLNVRYEIGTETPHKVVAKIISNLKEEGEI